MSHSHPPSTTASERGCWHNLTKWVRDGNRDEWLKDMRQGINLTVSIIATITFQSALNPPGGVMQANSNEDLKNCDSSDVGLCPGQAVLAVVYPAAYQSFLVCNTICFIASLSICLLLVSGLSLNYTFITWLLLLSLWVTITSLALTYLFGAIMVTPFAYEFHSAIASVFGKVVLSWIALLAILGFLLLIRLVAQGLDCIKGGNRSSPTLTTNTTTPTTNMTTPTVGA